MGSRAPPASLPGFGMPSSMGHALRAARLGCSSPPAARARRATPHAAHATVRARRNAPPALPKEDFGTSSPGDAWHSALPASARPTIPRRASAATPRALAAAGRDRRCTARRAMRRPPSRYFTSKVVAAWPSSQRPLLWCVVTRCGGRRQSQPQALQRLALRSRSTHCDRSRRGVCCVA